MRGRRPPAHRYAHAVFLALLALFIVVPFVEISVIIIVGHAIGALDTIALLLLCSVLGAWLAKRAGFGIVARVRRQVDAGRMPTNELIDGGIVLVAGVLLLTPGFVTDAVGLLLLLPPARIAVRELLKLRFRNRVTRVVFPGDDVIDV